MDDDVTGRWNVVLLGKTGAGKSLSGNTILGRDAFISMKSCTTVTTDVAVESSTVAGFPVTVYDTPGLFDIEMCEDVLQMINEKVLQKCASGRCVFLLVIKADRFTEEERKTVEKIEKMLGENNQKNSWILFTRGDELDKENMTIQEFINQSEQLKTLVQKYKHRYHVFNNNKKERQSEQVKMLFTKILKNYVDMEMAATKQVRRIVLLGKSGVGKSAAGNTILRRNEFTSVMSMNSVTSECSAAQATVSGRSVSVVDTPGFFHTHMNDNELMIEIRRSVYISSLAPHAFLIVFPVNMTFTEQEQQIAQMIEQMFGEEVLKYSIILFTHGDQLEGETMEEVIEEREALRSVVQQCGGRYQLFNNRDVNNRQQVEDLLQKIDSMILQNGGVHYSNQMIEDAQRARRVEEERRRREELDRQREARMRLREELDRQREARMRLREELDRQIEALRRQTEELERQRLREQAERRREEERARKTCVCS